MLFSFDTQVTSVIDNDNTNKLIPCLGLAWSNLVTTRFQIQRTDECFLHRGIDDDGDVVEYPLTVRKFETIFSPNLPSLATEFLITADGVVNVPDQLRRQRTTSQN